MSPLVVGGFGDASCDIFDEGALVGYTEVSKGLVEVGWHILVRP